jgi:hypothetical protein
VAALRATNQAWEDSVGNINVTPYAKPASTSGISLEVPPQTVNINYSLYYRSDGRLDYGRILAELEKKCSMEMGIGVALLPRALHDPEIMTPLKDGIIVNAILVNHDILAMFDFHPKSLGGEMIPCHIPVKMKGSGMLWSIWACPDKGGGYDLDRLVNDLEDSYRKVMFLDSGEVIFTPAHRSVIRQNGTKWIEKLKEQYRNHLADKFNYSGEPEYRYKEIQKYKFPTFSVTGLSGYLPLGSFTLWGTISVVRNKLDITVMVHAPAKKEGDRLDFFGSIILVKNGKPVARRGVHKNETDHWPKDKGSDFALGSASFQLEPPSPKDKWQLKFDVAYFHGVPGGGAPGLKADEVITVQAERVKFPDAIWELDREYEWLQPLR